MKVVFSLIINIEVERRIFGGPIAGLLRMIFRGDFVLLILLVFSGGGGGNCVVCYRSYAIFLGVVGVAGGRAFAWVGWWWWGGGGLCFHVECMDLYH